MLPMLLVDVVKFAVGSWSTATTFAKFYNRSSSINQREPQTAFAKAL